jgi:hypothetical protein
MVSSVGNGVQSGQVEALVIGECAHFYLTEPRLSPDQLDLIDASTLLSSG